MGNYISAFTKNMKGYMTGNRNLSDKDYLLIMQSSKEEYIAHAALCCHIKTVAQWAWNGFKL